MIFMAIYIAHCAEKENLDIILKENKIRTAIDISIKSAGAGDVVYFTFFDPNDSKQFYSANYCIYFRLRHILQKYKYYAVSTYDNYGQISADGYTRLSPKLYRIVKSAFDIEDLSRKIMTNPKISQQAKINLLFRAKELFEFKYITNPSLRYIYSHRGFWSEILFFENIDFGKIPYKIAKEK
ncbi:putative ORFan [Tupanvirus deep ocean]|uniref:ORFan n=2 Tax=Tupanvirus TaxID=2094720 RepID=A0AC62A6X3_9VIRU|nr:putative ORFan [Tupanvirus deep ocean]QKU33535.1 putative ORFan [Tupanvirus deep ocean]